jgi:hypothetical protein
MILEFTKQGTIKKYIVQGKIEIYKEDPALASVLKRIENGGGIVALGNLGVFGTGLKESFESEKLTLDGQITDKGREIAKTGFNWKGLAGRFVLDILELDGKFYLLNCIEYNGQDTKSYTDSPTLLQLKDEYRIVNGKNAYRNIRLDTHAKVEVTPKKVTVAISYDFDEKTVTYSVNNDLAFAETNNFSHIDYVMACAKLTDVVENYGLKTDNHDNVYIRDYNKSHATPLQKELIGNLFDKRGSIQVKKDEYMVKELRLIVDKTNDADELLYEYLSRAADKHYLGYSEVSSLISEFYGFFKSCTYISQNTDGVYSKMLERMSIENRKAFLRLQACLDIAPDITKSPFQLECIDLSNKNCSVEDIAFNIVGPEKDITSVTMITKYAYKNAAISRACGLLADALKVRYNVKLRLITSKDSKDQTYSARKFYEKLKNHPNVEKFLEKSEYDLKNIHDRYYRITHESGKNEWLVLTGELDTLRYDKDFIDGKARTDITHETKGTVKEMRIIRIKEEGLPKNVKKEMERM